MNLEEPAEFCVGHQGKVHDCPTICPQVTAGLAINGESLDLAGAQPSGDDNIKCILLQALQYRCFNVRFRTSLAVL